MEDQPTDTSDLTDTGGEETTSAPATNTPVGKSGRHRTFRPRRVTPPIAATTVEPDDEAPEDTVADDTAAAETVAADTVEVEPEPEPKRRGWFRRKPAEEAAGPADEEEPALGPVKERKPVGKKMAIAVAVAAALFVAAGAFGGAMLQPYLSDRVVADTKLAIARTATEAITTLFTYTPDDMDQLPARTAKYLGGELKDSYAKQVDALAATNKQNQIHRSAQVVGAAVESLNGKDATAVVYANITYTSAATKDVPKIFLVSYRLSMQRKGSDWLIVGMPWITSKDLMRVS